MDDIPAMLTSWEDRKELADQWKHQLKEAAAHNQWENPVPAHWEEKSCWFASLDTIANYSYRVGPSEGGCAGCGGCMKVQES